MEMGVGDGVGGVASVGCGDGSSSVSMSEISLSDGASRCAFLPDSSSLNGG